MRRPARVRLLGLVVAVVVVVGGCTSLPASGPIVETDVGSSVDDTSASDINPLPPRDGASSEEIVEGFLDAMTASPIRTEVALQFLTESAKRTWDPEAATITYGGKNPARVSGDSVTVGLVDAEELDRSGTWLGRLQDGEQELRLTVVAEDGEYRIADPPNALVVPDTWFNQRFRQASLYFFDVSGSILVPQPVFLPRGSQLASALVSGLLAGPGPDLRKVARSYLPAGASSDLSVPVSSTGLADITVSGEATGLTDQVADRMFAQLAWTLRQEPGVTAIRLTIGDQVVQLPDGGTDYPVSEATRYNPTGDGASRDLFALRNDVLAVRDVNQLVPVSGPFGAAAVDLRSAAVNLDASEAAGISRDATTVYEASLEAGSPRDVSAVDTVFDGGVDLLEPAWDFVGRLWLVDRRARGAVVRYVRDGRVQRIDVPGVSGQVVKSFLVSRDGTRFVAVVRGAAGDDLRVGRIQYGDRGQPSAGTVTTSLLPDPGEQIRIVDITWTSPTTVALLIPLLPDFFEVRTLSVAGAPTSATTLATTVSGQLVGLAGSPEADVPTYGIYSEVDPESKRVRTGLVDLLNESTYGFVGEPTTAIGYVG